MYLRLMAFALLSICLAFVYCNESHEVIVIDMKAERQQAMRNIAPIVKQEDTDAMLQLAINALVSRSEIFRNYLNKKDSHNVFNVDVEELAEDLAWLEQYKFASISNATEGEVLRLTELMEFNTYLAYDANDKKPIVDVDLFMLHLCFYQSPTPFIESWGRSAMTYFSKRLIQKYAGIIVKPYLENKHPYNELCRLCLDQEFFDNYRVFFDKCIENNNAALRKLIINDDKRARLNLLKENACFGDPDARNSLLRLFAECRVVRETKNELQMLLDCLRAICHKDVAMALLQRFNEVWIDDNGEIRGISGKMIWRIFIRWYPDDEFILKYHERIGDFHDGKHDGTDKETKQFFEELKKWAKNKFNFDLVLPPERMSFVKFEQQIYVD